MKLLASSFLFLALALAGLAYARGEDGALGYYRSPGIHGDTVVFTSEGDLWQVGLDGGLARRLTTHPQTETGAHISPDGAWIAFSASYEGPQEVYVMPVGGGAPKRCTYGEGARIVGWTPDGKVMYASSQHTSLPDLQLLTVDPKTLISAPIPLSQASDGCYSDDGKTLFFTRFAFQGSNTKRYQGGTAQNIWRWDGGESEAKPLTADFKGTSRSPMFWNGRIYFVSDRDGVMNIWSMDPNGRNLKEHTHAEVFDVLSPSLDAGRIVFQSGADIHLLDLSTGVEKTIPIRLASDFDQMREQWVKDPMQWTSAQHLSPDGTRIALTSRGQVFIAPVKQGRLIEVTRNAGVRYRDARFSSDGKSIIALSDESGEVELWKLPAAGDGSGAPEQLTKDGTILRWQTLPSPDGKWIAHTDKNHRLYLYDVEAKTNKKIAESDMDDFSDLTWSPDSKWLAYTRPTENQFSKVELYSIATGTETDVTTDRFNSGSPAFTPDGKWLYLLSDRHLATSVSSPWGPRAPEPYFDKQQEIFYIALQTGLRSPWQPDDELVAAQKPAEKKEDASKKADAAKPALPAIELNGIAQRIYLAPLPPGNYSSLSVSGDRLFFVSSTGGSASLVSAQIKNKDAKVTPILANVSAYETTADGKKILAKSGGNLFVFDANGQAPDATESRVDLSGWTFSFDPKEEWRQMFDEAWRLHRDYLYDPNMQHVDWPAMKVRYRPLVDRISDRSELSDVLAQMVGEVSLLHSFVYGGDMREGTDSVNVASLAAEWRREDAAGGYRVTKIYRTDPDDPSALGPLLQPGVEVAEGDVVSMIDGVSVLDVPSAAALLRAQAGKQVRLKILPGGDKTRSRDVIVTPLSSSRGIRYDSWEYSRRQAVESASKGDIGYVHLRAMGSSDFDQWARDFYPVFDRQGLIVDVRHNNGGNIDSWILEKLLRRAWMYWRHRQDKPYWNMQYAFRGKIVVLCDEWTASDGEAFSEGFKRLGLGTVIGTRTWGGEVWLTSSNRLVDNGIATAAEMGVYGPEGKWLVEGHGVDPDIVVDNLPHSTYTGSDAQLDAAIKFLQEEIAKHPNPVPNPPPFPDKSFHPAKGGGK